MKKNVFLICYGHLFAHSMKIFKVMRISIFLLFLTIFQSYAVDNYAQEKKLDIKLANATIADVLGRIEDQSDFYFFYNNKTVNTEERVSVDFSQKSIFEVLDALFSGKDIEYTVNKRQIVLMSKGESLNYLQQKKTVSGTVSDESGQPLPGVAVVVKGSNVGVTTDIDGKFSLEVPAGSGILQFSFVGMKAQEVDVKNQTFINVVLAQDVIGLEEVVAIGYGTMKKSDLTGSVTQIKSDDLMAVTTSNPIEALQGRASGVSVINDDASPGANPTIRIRGSGSITAGNDPLIVVDGFPLVNNNLNDINSNDIETMEILKDASSAAIYGSRGANGVILITTKKGSKGQNNLEVNGTLGIATPSRVPEMLGRADFLNFINEAYTYSNGVPVYSSSNPAPSYDVNWHDEIISKSSKVQNYSVAFSGGKDKTTYMLSSNIFSQDGMVQASGFNKLTVRANLDHEFKSWLSVGTHLQVGRTQRDVRDNPTGNIFRYGWATVPVKNPNGSWYYATEDPSISSYFEGTWNPAAEAAEVTNELTSDRVLGDIFALITPMKNVTFKTNFGVDIANEKQYEYYTSKSSAGIGSGSTGTGGQTYRRRTSRLTDNILTYTNTWNQHRLTATGVYSWQEYVYEDMETTGSGFLNDATGANDMSYASKESISVASNKYSNRLISWTARAAYSYADKYLLTVTGRYDGSSRFGENNKWGFFPSVGLGWRVDQEPFLKNNELISLLKIRTSYGVTGNQEIGNYQSLSSLSTAYYVFDGVPILGFAETIGNPDLKWERNIQYNVGVDVSFWDRLDLNLDYYSRQTTDLLYNVPIPTTSGYSSMLKNIGEVKNVGIELTAHTRIIDSSDLKWDITANVSKNRNEIVELYGDVEKINLGSSTGGISQYLVVGEPVNSLWARESAGIITTQEQLDAYKTIRSSAELGEEMYVDKNDDKTINTEDYINIGSIEPDFFYGISTSFTYKNLSMDIYSQGATGIAAQDENSGYLTFGENQIQNRNYLPTKYAYERMWSESNPNGTFPRAGAQEVYLSDRTNGGWHYFIVKNIKFGYNFSSMIQNIDWLSELNFYVNAQNYLNFANHRGYNPENGKVDFPYAKTMIFGIRAKF